MRFLKYGSGDFFRRKTTTTLSRSSYSQPRLFSPNPPSATPPLPPPSSLTSLQKAHRDGSYVTPDRSERSFFTLHLYLNDSAVENETSDLRGGATTFHSWNMQRRLDVHPKTGRVLIFQHMELLHSGNDVLAGTKLTMRTDLMYRRI